ncbi:NUDIX domain-containing protein [Streptococcus merionis]|uniref:NUDIX domain-containing protein n=1 Tax=Streptococcus merionis TaxID=400065 RepID=UPI0035191CD7
MEIWDIYDQKNQLTGQTIARKDVHLLKEGHFHACVNALLRDEAGNILVQQRSLQKETNPGVWDIFTGGSILAGENPDQGITREVAEELGLINLDFHYHGYDVRADIKSIMHYYTAVIPEESKSNIVIQKSELAQVIWLSVQDAVDLVKDRPFDRKWLNSIITKVM